MLTFVGLFKIPIAIETENRNSKVLWPRPFRFGQASGKAEQKKLSKK